MRCCHGTPASADHHDHHGEDDHGHQGLVPLLPSSQQSLDLISVFLRCDTINVNGHTNLRLTLNMMNPIAPDPWVSSQAMPHINYALRQVGLCLKFFCSRSLLLQAGHSDSAADELTRALGLLAAHGVLQLTQSAAKPEPHQHQQVTTRP